MFCTSVFADANKSIIITDYGWHAGIVLKTEDINTSLLHIDPSLQSYHYIEFGWGDADFYKSDDPSVWTTLKAVFVPSSSVVHVRALHNHDLETFSKEHIEKLTLPHENYTQLLRFIDNSFSKQDTKYVLLSNGLYKNSFFYLSDKEYHIFNTCNTWTAEALHSAGINISPSVYTTQELFHQIDALDRGNNK